MSLGMMLTPVITALEGQRQEDLPQAQDQPRLHGEFQASLTFEERPCLKTHIGDGRHIKDGGNWDTDDPGRPLP